MSLSEFDELRNTTLMVLKEVMEMDPSNTAIRMYARCIMVNGILPEEDWNELVALRNQLRSECGKQESKDK